MNSSDLRAQLTWLQLERIEAFEIGLTENHTYMADLEEDILECRTRLAIASVTEVAVAEAQLSGPLFG